MVDPSLMTPETARRLAERGDNAKAVAREPLVSRTVAELEKRLAELEETVQALEDRLHPVLRPAPPPDAQPGMPKLDDDLAVPLARDLFELKDRVQKVTKVLGEITDRIEL